MDVEERFNEFLAKEFSDPEYGAVHHLTVPCFHLQANKYSRQGWFLVRERLRQFVSGELTPPQAVEMNKNDKQTKDFNLTKGEKLSEVDAIRWSLTIADVDDITGENYRRDIMKWATSILRDTEYLIKEQDGNNKQTRYFDPPRLARLAYQEPRNREILLAARDKRNVGRKWQGWNPIS